MRVADKGSVAGNFGIIMMMITNKYFADRMMVEELTRKKEAEETHELLKMVRMELITKVEQIENKLHRKLQHLQLVLAESISM